MADGGGSRLPSTHRGVSGFRNGYWVGIDWCAFSVDVHAVLRETGHDKRDRDLVDATDDADAAYIVASIARDYFLGPCVEIVTEARKGKFYKWRFVLTTPGGEHCGLVEVGGEHTRRKDGAATLRVELTGEGCTAYEGRDLAAGSAHAKRWVELRAKLESCEGRIARCDVACDDFAGEHTVAECKAMYEAGAFDRRGQKPKGKFIDDMGSGEGCTMYVGSRSSEHILRCYDKDKEQGDVNGVRVRWEAEFHASSRKPIDLDILRDPESYFRGAYPMLDFIKGCLARFETVGANREACFKSLFRHVRRQYGKAFNFLYHALDSDEAVGGFVVRLRRPGLPPWAEQFLGAQAGDNALAFANI